MKKEGKTVILEEVETRLLKKTTDTTRLWRDKEKKQRKKNKN